jgi:hypothetical protein
MFWRRVGSVGKILMGKRAELFHIADVDIRCKLSWQNSDSDSHSGRLGVGGWRQDLQFPPQSKFPTSDIAFIIISFTLL